MHLGDRTVKRAGSVGAWTRAGRAGARLRSAYLTLNALLNALGGAGSDSDSGALEGERLVMA